MKIQSFILTSIPKGVVKSLRLLTKWFKKLPLGAFILVIVGKVAALIFNELGFVINSVLAYHAGGNPELRRYWKSNAVMNDKKLNVTLQYTLNAVFIKGKVSECLEFGCEFSTVSDHIGRLPQVQPFGVWTRDVFLDSIEDNHCGKAVELNNKALLKRVTELNILNKNNNMDTIAEIRAAYNAMLDSLAAGMGENTSLSGSQKATIAEQADAVTETVDPNLPPRPHA